ncbi:MAG TPA: ATP-binding protein [Streptosporangiaceae bacterium]|nr:ATP-binding protein [Streptosporangiaceae bacterium]
MRSVRTDHDPITLGQSLTAPAQRLLARRTFPGQPGQVSVARQWLTRLIDGFEAADEVLLACSELAANAIIHSDSGRPGGVFTVRVAVEPDIVRLEVLDQGGSWTRRRCHENTAIHPEDATQCGRGLTIVAAITSAWGIAGDHHGRTAWCEIKSQ